jgi:multiple sugar transport system ATP-binding protein
MSGVAFDKVFKTYDNGQQVVHGVDLEIGRGEFVVFVGPSGCGKSTLLRMLAGLEKVSGGTISIEGRVVNELPPRERDIAMVFQDYALYPHKSVYDNLAFGLRLRKLPPDEIRRRVEEAAVILKIGHLLERKPRALSGGQRQRVAMGRAIVRQPKAFLFDEPLSNLDAQLRAQMRVEIKKLHQRIGATTIYVTHDQVEAMTLAQRIVVLSGGRIMQVGTPDEIYNRPRSRFVAGFTGSPPMNFLPGRVHVAGERVTVVIGAADGAALVVPASRAQALRALAGREIAIGIRPEDIRLAAGADSDQPLAAQVVVSEPLGAETLLTLAGPAGEFVARVGPAAGAAPGSAVRAWLDMGKLHAFDPATGEAVGAGP